MFVFPAAAPLVVLIDIPQPSTREDIISRSGVQCADVSCLKARIDSVIKAISVGHTE